MLALEELKSFKQYEDMKESGVEWLGEIPEHWDFSKVKFHTRILTGGTPSKNNEKYWEKGNIPWMVSGDINQKIIRNVDHRITELGHKNSPTKKLPINSIMIALNGQGKTKGTVGILKVETTCNQSLAAYICNNITLRSKYLYYYLDCNYKNIRGLVGDAQRDGLNLTIISNIITPLPTLNEQSNIITFLDKETSKLDQLIAKKQRLVDLLQEKRQALISHAVTKGLDPSVPMKESGVEWLGEIPEHWIRNRLKFSTYIKGRIGWQALTTDEFTDEGPYCVTGTDFSEGKINWETCYHVSEERYKMDKNIQLKEKDLLITKDGTIGKLAIVENIPSKACLNSGIFVTRPHHDEYLTQFMYYVLDSNVFTQYINYNKTGTTIAHLYQYVFENFSYPQPPINEQTEITNFLRGETLKLDQLTSKLNYQIQLIKEYRKALIRNAVTGKIDVRGETK